MPRLYCLIGLCCALLAFAGCGHSVAVLEQGHLSINVSSLAPSELTAADLQVDSRPQTDGSITVQLERRGMAPLHTALLELHFPKAYQATQIEDPAAEFAQLRLAVSDQPGLLAYGVIMPEGQLLPSGRLLSFRLVPASVPRLTATAPSAQGGLVSDLSASHVGADLQLDWGYVSKGDYNQDGLVNVADLSQIGIHFQESGPWDYNQIQSVVDGTPDGVISVADLTPIGLNYLRKVSGYNIYRSNSETISADQLTLLDSVELSSALGDSGSRKQFRTTIASNLFTAANWFVVAPTDSADSSIGPYSNPVSAAGGTDTTPPTWSPGVGIAAVTASATKVVVSWNTATDADSPPVTYSLFYQEGATLDYLTANVITFDAGVNLSEVGGLTTGQLYSFAVRASDSAPVPNMDQNTVVMQATPEVPKSFAIPPAGTQTVEAMSGQSPQLTIIPAATSNASQGAPAIFTLKNDASPAGTHVYCARFHGGVWEQTRIMEASSYATLAAFALEDSPGVVTFHVFTYDTASGKLLHVSFDDTLTQTDSEEVSTNPTLSQPLAQLSVDYDPATGDWGALQGCADTSTGSLRFSYKPAAGAWTTLADSYTGDAVLSTSFRFDPAGGDAWLAFNHGTIDTSTSVAFNVVAETGRFNGSAVTFSALDYTDDAVQLALGFKADNTPLLAFSAVRAIAVSTFSADVLFDAVVGEYDGSSWSYTVVYTSGFTPHIGFPNTTVDLDLAPTVSWAASQELMVGAVEGSIILDTLTQQINGGSLDIAPSYRTAALANYAQESTYFDGDPGLGFSWAPAAGGPAAAYIGGSTLDVNALLAGDLGSNGALLYWSK